VFATVWGSADYGLVVQAGTLVLFFPACRVPQGMAGVFICAARAHRVSVFVDCQNV